MISVPITLRAGAPDDAATISALAIQVFLDTYAADGVRPDLAREALREYAAEAFDARLREPQRRFVLAERGTGLLGFAELTLAHAAAPAGEAKGGELIRLYVQPAAQGSGLGRQLIRAAEALAADAGLSVLWLTAWDGNLRALAFYAREGYADVGATSYSFEGNSYANRVLAAPASPPAAAPVPQAISAVDVTAKLEQLASANPEKLNWRICIVDLLKLLGLDSSLAARKELATELHCPADKLADSAQMNMWLHKTVLQKLADNGGKVPAELL